MNKKVATLNVPALWSPVPSMDMNVRSYKNNFPYQDNDEIKIASPDRPIYRYAKNFTVEKLSFSICLFSNEGDTSAISKYFDSLLYKLSKSEISKALVTATGSNFMYLDERYSK